MSDPYGALAMQRKGDVGIYNGHQYIPSGQGLGIVAIFRTTPGSNTANDVLAGTGLTTHGSLAEFIEGSAAHPVTAHDTATVMISRRSAMNIVDDSNAALMVSHVNDGATQPVAISAYTNNLDAVSGDSCGIYVRSGSTAGGAFGIFLLVAATTTNLGAQAVNPVVVNASGANISWVPAPSPGGISSVTSPSLYGIMLQTIASPTHVTGIGIRFIANDSQWDVGILFDYNVCKSATIVDETGSTTSYVLSGVHTTGITTANANISGLAAYFSSAQSAAQVRIQGVGNIETGLEISTPAGHNGQFAMVNFEVGGTLLYSWGWNGGLSRVGLYDRAVGTELVGFSLGTPGAGNTNMTLQQGAGPTTSLIKYFADGSGHNVLYF